MTASFVLMAAIIQIACQSSTPIDQVLLKAQSQMDSGPDRVLLAVKGLDPKTYYQAERETLNMAYAVMNRAVVYLLTVRSPEAVGGYLWARELFERAGDSVKMSEMTRDIVSEMLDRDDVTPDSLKRLLCRAYSVAGFDRILMPIIRCGRRSA